MVADASKLLAILDEEEVVQVTGRRKVAPGFIRVLHESGLRTSYLPMRIKKCLSVRILENGTAKEINPLGEYHEFVTEPNIFSQYWAGQDYTWRIEEEKCLELPFKMLNEGQWISMQSEKISHPYYAFTKSINGVEHFILVKPIKRA